MFQVIYKYVKDLAIFTDGTPGTEVNSRGSPAGTCLLDKQFPENLLFGKAKISDKNF